MTRWYVEPSTAGPRGWHNLFVRRAAGWIKWAGGPLDYCYDAADKLQAS